MKKFYAIFGLISLISTAQAEWTSLVLSGQVRCNPGYLYGDQLLASVAQQRTRLSEPELFSVNLDGYQLRSDPELGMTELLNPSTGVDIDLGVPMVDQVCARYTRIVRLRPRIALEVFEKARPGARCTKSPVTGWYSLSSIARLRIGGEAAPLMLPIDGDTRFTFDSRIQCEFARAAGTEKVTRLH